MRKRLVQARLLIILVTKVGWVRLCVPMILFCHKMMANDLSIHFFDR